MIAKPLKDVNSYAQFGSSHLESILCWVCAIICGTCLYFLLVHLLQECDRLRYRQRPQIPHIFISVAVRASFTQLLTYLSGIEGGVLVVPPNPVEVTGSATKKMKCFWEQILGC